MMHNLKFVNLSYSSASFKVIMLVLMLVAEIYLYPVSNKAVERHIKI